MIEATLAKKLYESYTNQKSSFHSQGIDKSLINRLPISNFKELVEDSFYITSQMEWQAIKELLNILTDEDRINIINKINRNSDGLERNDFGLLISDDSLKDNLQKLIDLGILEEDNSLIKKGTNFDKIIILYEILQNITISSESNKIDNKSLSDYASILSANLFADNIAGDLDWILFALSDENRFRIIEYLKIKAEKGEEASVKETQEYMEKNYGVELSLQTIKEHFEILKKARLIGKDTPNNDYNNRDVYYLEEIQTKRIEKLKEILIKPTKELEKDNSDRLRAIINLLKDDEVLIISDEFMENVPAGGWMDICYAKESPKNIVELQLYKKGYKKMKERGVKIRVITELTQDNREYCLKMLKDNLLDEIRCLKNIKCGFAVSENQYMAAFIPDNAQNNSSNIMTNAIFTNDKNIIKYGQSLFDMCWENAIPILDKYEE